MRKGEAEAADGCCTMMMEEMRGTCRVQATWRCEEDR